MLDPAGSICFQDRSAWLSSGGRCTKLAGPGAVLHHIQKNPGQTSYHRLEHPVPLLLGQLLQLCLKMEQQAYLRLHRFNSSGRVVIFIHVTNLHLCCPGSSQLSPPQCVPLTDRSSPCSSPASLYLHLTYLQLFIDIS